MCRNWRGWGVEKPSLPTSSLPLHGQHICQMPELEPTGVNPLGACISFQVMLSWASSWGFNPKRKQPQGSPALSILTHIQNAEYLCEISHL